MIRLRRGPRIPTISPAEEKSMAFDPAAIERFRAVHAAQGGILVLLEVVVECLHCGRFFATTALSSVPIASQPGGFGPFKGLELPERMCPACRGAR